MSQDSVPLFELALLKGGHSASAKVSAMQEVLGVSGWGKVEQMWEAERLLLVVS